MDTSRSQRFAVHCLFSAPRVDCLLWLLLSFVSVVCDDDDDGDDLQNCFYGSMIVQLARLLEYYVLQTIRSELLARPSG